ncbi:MAG: hypothetical protein H6710_01295 [Myxococcales bacterium]|nr:hypothetical protein [Myxococcales bacterium]
MTTRRTQGCGLRAGATDRALASLAALALIAGCPPSEYNLSDGKVEPTSGSESTGDQPCLDGVKQPWESDVDCGGPICEPCGAGLGCKVDADCLSGICALGVCSDDPCDAPDACPMVAAPCLVSSCVPGVGCVLEPVRDGLPCDGLGGPGDPPPPDLSAICIGGACVPACAVECAALDGPCRTGFCNPQTGNCGVEWARDGLPCMTDEALEGSCEQGVCVGAPATSILYLFSFDDPNAPWEADPPWEIGPPKPSGCSSSGIEDPEIDHSGFPEGGLAGLVIGECVPPLPPPGACITSPPLETKVQGEIILRYWEVLDLPQGPGSGATIEVHDGLGWNPVPLSEHLIGPEWTERELSLSAIADPPMQLRFCASLGMMSPPASGWSIDDVTIECLGCQP